VVNRAWVREQLTLIGASAPVYNAVNRLLDVAAGFTERERDLAIDAFIKLIKGEALYVEPDNDDHTAWAPAQRGFLNVGDVIRVKTSAYASDAGIFHNGRVGKIVAIRYGDIIVRYIDGREPNPDTGARHSPDVLEKKFHKP